MRIRYHSIIHLCETFFDEHIECLILEALLEILDGHYHFDACLCDGLKYYLINLLTRYSPHPIQCLWSTPSAHLLVDLISRICASTIPT